MRKWLPKNKWSMTNVRKNVLAPNKHTRWREKCSQTCSTDGHASMLANIFEFIEHARLTVEHVYEYFWCHRASSSDSRTFLASSSMRIQTQNIFASIIGVTEYLYLSKKNLNLDCCLSVIQSNIIKNFGCFSLRNKNAVEWHGCTINYPFLFVKLIVFYLYHMPYLP